MKEPRWLRAVSFKTELLSEWLIHRGYREDLGTLLPKLGFLHNRMILDNDIYIDLNEVDEIQTVLDKDLTGLADEAYAAIEAQSKILLRISRKVAGQPVKELGGRELLEYFQQFIQELQKALGALGVPTVIDMSLEKRIRANLVSLYKDRTDEMFTQLAVSEKPIGTFAERDELLAIGEQAENEGEELMATSPEIVAHAKKYGWIRSTLFLGEPYGPDSALQEIEKLSGKATREREQINKRREKLLQEADEAVTMLPEAFRKEARFLRKAIYYRTARLEWLNEACYLARPLLEEISRRLDVCYEDAIYLEPNELVGAMKGDDLVPMNRIRERKAGYGLISDSDAYCKLIVGRELDEWRERMRADGGLQNYLKGIVACRGRAQGRVIIVKDRTELGKVRDGDILVTPLTTPDFIVAMKKASAIVTDLGGLTSHAAIVARELNVPCIVGTRHATEVLKDKAMVIVDGNTGTVQMVKE